MRSIGMLMFKDLVQQRQRVLLGCSMLLIFGFSMALNAEARVGSTAGILTGLVMVTSLGTAYDEDQGGLAYLRSLPLAPREIVAGKFLSSLGFAIIYMIAAFLPMLLCSRQQLSTTVSVSIVTALCVGLLLSGLVLTVFFRYGYRAIQLYLIYFWLGFIGLAVGLQMLWKMIPTSSALPTRWFAWLSAIDTWSGERVAVVVLATTGILYLTLAWFAERNLRNRDL